MKRKSGDFAKAVAIKKENDDSEDFSVKMITSSVQQLKSEYDAEKENVVEKHQLQNPRQWFWRVRYVAVATRLESKPRTK